MHVSLLNLWKLMERRLIYQVLGQGTTLFKGGLKRSFVIYDLIPRSHTSTRRREREREGEIMIIPCLCY